MHVRAQLASVAAVHLARARALSKKGRARLVAVSGEGESHAGSRGLTISLPPLPFSARVSTACFGHDLLQMLVLLSSVRSRRASLASIPVLRGHTD